MSRRMGTPPGARRTPPGRPPSRSDDRRRTQGLVKRRICVRFPRESAIIAAASFTHRSPVRMPATSSVLLSSLPNADEHLPYYTRYISTVPAGDVLATLESQLQETTSLLRGIGEEN